MRKGFQPAEQLACCQNILADTVNETYWSCQYGDVDILGVGNTGDVSCHILAARICSNRDVSWCFKAVTRLLSCLEDLMRLELG